jgi:hypothetical protein
MKFARRRRFARKLIRVYGLTQSRRVLQIERFRRNPVKKLWASPKPCRHERNFLIATKLDGSDKFC